MGTVFDYIKWRGDLTFSEAPLNDVDSLIFSLLSYLDFRGIVPEEHGCQTVPIRAAANTFFARNPDYRKFSMGLIVPKEIGKLFRVLKDTRRFRNVNMKAHVNVIDTEQEIQFSATTFLLDNGIAVVAFRGTDDTIVGWKENFNMSFLPVVPAQLAALSYLRQAANGFAGPIAVTGHSKGGNLAVYASVFAEPAVQDRIVCVWNNDGPGFGNSVFDSPAYRNMIPKIRSFVPESAVVGMLLEHSESYFVVKSKQTGVFQHNGLSWEVLGGSFVQVETITAESKRLDQTLHAWIYGMTPEQREAFVDALYRILSADDALTLTELVGAKRKWLSKSKHLDPKVRKTVLEVLSALININTKNLFGGMLSSKGHTKSTEEK